MKSWTVSIGNAFSEFVHNKALEKLSSNDSSSNYPIMIPLPLFIPIHYLYYLLLFILYLYIIYIIKLLFNNNIIFIIYIITYIIYIPITISLSHYLYYLFQVQLSKISSNCVFIFIF